MGKEATKGDENHSSMPLSWPCGIPFRHDAAIVYQNMQLIPTYTPPEWGDSWVSGGLVNTGYRRRQEATTKTKTTKKEEDEERGRTPTSTNTAHEEAYTHSSWTFAYS